MKKFMQEFKTFALRGNVMDMAVGVIIGSAFSGIVTSLTDNFINPILNLVTGGATYTLQDVASFASSFLTAVVNFLVMAFVLFCLLKGMNKLASLAHKKEEAPATATTKKCPYCKTEIAIDATRIAHRSCWMWKSRKAFGRAQQNRESPFCSHTCKRRNRMGGGPAVVVAAGPFYKNPPRWAV